MEFGIRGLQRDFNLTQDGRIEPGRETERVVQRLAVFDAVPPREPLTAQIDDQRRFLAEQREELEAAKRDLAGHQKALAEAEADLEDLKRSLPDAEPLDPEDFERPDQTEEPSRKDRRGLRSAAKKAGRAAAVEFLLLKGQIEIAEIRVKELRNDETAKSAVGPAERRSRREEARLEALLRKQREMTGGESPP